MPASSGEECEGSAQKAEVLHDDPMEGATEESLSDKRERETPDTATKPDGKAQRAFNAAPSTAATTLIGRGTTALDPEPDASSDDEECSDDVELDKAWQRITTAKRRCHNGRLITVLS